MGKKILIVDDILENIQIIISVFEKNNPEFELFQAPNGYLALNIAKKVIPDIIITDWDMPEMNGIDLITKLKQETKLKDIPVIMATGVMTSVEYLQMALSAGAVDYIKKPIDEVELVARTLSALNLSEYNKRILEQKNQELIENTLFLIRNNKFNVQISEKLKELSNNLSKNDKQAFKIIKEISAKISTKIKTDSWKRFDVTFNAVYDDFYKNLHTDFPDLTASEVKLSTFLKLGLNTKDISSILYITPQSVKVSRSRLRKKLGISQDVNLQAFLSKY